MCSVGRFLSLFTNGELEQFTIIINDRTRNPHIIARSLEQVDGAPAVTGVDILKHQQHTCDCWGWID